MSYSSLCDSAWEKYSRAGYTMSVLDDLEQMAFAVEGFDAQTQNGGLQQFIYNGYCLHLPYLKKLVDLLLVQHPTSTALSLVRQIVDTIYPCVRFEAPYRGVMGDYLKDPDFIDHPVLEDLTLQYYQIMDEFMKIVEFYFE